MNPTRNLRNNTEIVPASEAVRQIVLSLILTILTCGLYNLYWNAKQMETINSLIGRNEFNFWTWLLIICALHLFL